MNSIRIKKQNEYVIEVNDQGETIVFNIEDPELPLKLDRAVEKINRIQNHFKQEELVVNKKQDEKGKGVLTKKEKAVAELSVKMFKEMREAVDEFLGENACYKIFGQTNYMSMFDDLFEQLGPHFEKMQLNAQNYMESIQKKYSHQEDDILR